MGDLADTDSWMLFDGDARCQKKKSEGVAVYETTAHAHILPAIVIEIILSSRHTMRGILRSYQFPVGFFDFR